MADSEDVKNVEYQAYLGQREALNRMELESSGRYDRWILTLSGGALAVSLTFLERIAPKPIPSTLWLILSAWGVLVITIVCALCSHLTSQAAIRKARDNLDDNYGKRTVGKKRPNRAASVTKVLNVFSMITFAVAVILLCVFSFCNFLWGAGG